MLSVGKKTEDEVTQELLAGFGGSLKAILAGAAIAGSMNNYSTHSVVTGGLVGGGVEWLADNMVEVVWQTITTDLQITEKTGKKHQTRVISIAKKTNLKLEEALPQLTQELAKSISGML